MSTDSWDTLNVVPLVAVLTIPDESVAGDLARVLVDNGLTHVEVALRTDASLNALTAMADVAGLTVGAGTLVTEQQMRESLSAGASFGVSPGLDPALVSLADELGLPYLPGVGSASEVQHAVRLGLTHLKYFPAFALGGAPGIEALSAPFAGVRFLPSGGVSAANLRDYLAVPAVFAVSGAWMVPNDALRDRSWARVGATVAEAVASAAEARR